MNGGMRNSFCILVTKLEGKRLFWVS